MKLLITNLSKTYRNGVKALDNISLEINAGMFGLLGPNGAGKSSLMRTLATLQKADSGTVTLGDIDVLNEPDQVKKLLGYLPQEFGVYPNVSAVQLLNYYAFLKGILHKGDRRHQVAHLLNQVNLYAARHKNVDTFSGGMRQRFGIAQALLGNPRLIIVDEPTAGLDPAERIRFNNLLSEISESVIVILSTHLVEDVSDLCSEMAIIQHGRVLLTGRPSDFIERYEGLVWTKKIGKQELDHYKARYNIIYSHLQEGKPLIHVVSDENPGEGFKAVTPGLQDVYFSTITTP